MEFLRSRIMYEVEKIHSCMTNDRFDGSLEWLTKEAEFIEKLNYGWGDTRNPISHRGCALCNKKSFSKFSKNLQKLGK